MADDDARPGGSGLLATLGRALRAALGVGGLCALVDLWRIALTEPGSLSVGAAGFLLAAYVGGTLAVVLVLLPGVWLVRRAALPEAAPVVVGLLLAAWAVFLAQGALLGALPPESGWRTPAVLGLVLAGILAVWPLGAVAARRVPGLLVVAWVLVAVGAFGAVRGFTAPPASRTPAAPDPAVAAPDTRPNVLLITIDSLRADHLTCYGYTRPTSPVLDGLAKEGVVFSRAYSQSSWTKPAVASLLTAQFPSMHQTNLERSRLPEVEVLLTEAMRDAGYATAVLSANPWVAGDYGFDQGVDHFYSPHDVRLARGSLLVAALEAVGGPRAMSRVAPGPSATSSGDEQLQAEAARWIGEHRHRRFFMYVHMMAPHSPYDPPRPYDTMFVPRPQDPPVTSHPRKSYFFGEEGEALSGPKLADMVGRYDGEIRFADTVVGKVLASLRETDVLDRTLVVVTADHGEELYDHKNWGHGHSLYDEVLRVPLIVRYPTRFPAGIRIDVPVMSVDVMPTILELTNARTGAPGAGRSLVGLVADPGANRPEAFAELVHRYGTARALVSHGKKLIEIAVGEDRRREMYDVRADPQEDWKIVPQEAPELFERLAALTEWAERHRVDPVETHVTEAAKALGYPN